MLYKTIHGSHLYGLAHADSDLDYYTVLETQPKKKAKYAKQSIVDGVDSMTVDWGTWVNMCQSGVPQALEAMFSTKPIFEATGIREFRDAFRVGNGMRDRYRRTLDNFLNDPDNFKKKRHALRLAINLRDGLRYGRFNPTLAPKTAIWVTFHAKHDEYEAFKNLVYQVADS